MKTKTIKTPSVGLILFQSLCAQCYDSVFKSALLRQSHTTRHNHWCGSSPQKEKPRFAKKQLSLKYKHENNVFFVFPLMMFSVAKQRVMMAGLLRELAHRQKAMPSAQKTSTILTLARPHSAPLEVRDGWRWRCNSFF